MRFSTEAILLRIHVLLIICIWKICRISSAVSIPQVVIYKCCAVNDNNSLEFNDFVKNESKASGGNVSIELKYFLDNDNQSSSVRKDSAIEATFCHKNEDNLTNRILFKYNESDNGFYYNSGYLRYSNDYYSPNQYCLEKVTNYDAIVKVRSKPNCDGGSCLKKCCGPMEVYDLSTYGKSRILCVPSLENPWDPVVYSKNGLTKQSSSESSLTFKSDHPRNWCTDNIVLWSMQTIRGDKKSLFRILDDGSVLKRDGYAWKELNSSRVCFDGAINFPSEDDHLSPKTYYSGEEFDTIILECGPAEAKEESYPTLLYGTALCISSLFLLATLIVYGLLWDKQNLHGKTLLSYVTSMFLFYISLITTYFYLYHSQDADFTNEKEIFNSFCGIIAVISHFLYISIICWLTVISFDIFAKFRILKLTRARSNNKLRFFVYFLFATLVPFSIVSTGVILDIVYGDSLEVNVIIPRYGWNKCFLDLQTAAIPYLFGPIGILLCLNCILYIATIVAISKISQSTKFASAGASNSQIQKQRAKIRLFSKLFLLMGISWIFEFVSFVAFGSDANVVVIVGDMINILQPILVFIIFVCKRDILQSLCQKYSTLAKIFSSLEIEDFTPSTSSNGVSSGKLTKFWNPVANTKWFRSRVNSTMTDTSNISNQSIRSALHPIEETPLPPVVTSNSPLKVNENSC